MRFQVHLVIDPDRLKRDRGTDGMAPVGEAVAEGAERVRVLIDWTEQFVVYGNCRDREVGARELLGERHELRRHVPGLCTEPSAGAPESGDDLVGDQQDVVAAQDLANRGPVALGRRDSAAGTDGRLADERTDRARVLGENERVELGASTLGEVELGLAVVAVFAPVMARCPNHVSFGQREPIVHVRHTRQRSARGARTVVAIGAGDDPGLGRAAECLLVESGELDGGVDSLRPGAGKEDPLEPVWELFGQRLGQTLCGLGDSAHEVVVPGKCLELAGGRLNQALVAEPKRRAPQS